jgi:uncharacterized protein YkwD
MTRERSQYVIHVVAVLTIVIVLMSCAGPKTGSVPMPVMKKQPIVTVADLEQRIHDLVNRARKDRGLPALSMDGRLTDIARGHSRDMSRRNYFSHFSPEGRDFTSRYQQAGYRCAITKGSTVFGGAENIALGYLFKSVTIVAGREYHDWLTAADIAELVVDGWMNSSGHRKNILTPYWSHQGIGVFIGPDSRIFVTQNFC